MKNLEILYIVGGKANDSAAGKNSSVVSPTVKHRINI